MARRIGHWICLWLIVSLAPIRAGQNSGDLLNDSEIRRLAAERIKALGGEQNGLGIVVGTISSEGRKIISAGERSLDDPRPPDGDTVFEIGSVTKVFTALLLAEMAEKNEVGLNNPVAKYLPAGFKVPVGNGKTISLLDLAMHTSGLPFMPNESAISDDSAAANYSTADLRTAFALSPKMKTNFAAGHNAVLQAAPPISTLPIYSIMPSAGGLYSTANDLLKLLAVAMGYEHSPLDGAMRLTWNTRRPMSGGFEQGGFEQALGWTIIREQNSLLIVHDGGTFGYATSIAWDPFRRVGVVVLSNQVANVGDIARHLLRPSIPLEKPTATKRTEVALDPATLDIYVGNYEATGEGIFAVARDADSLTIRSPAEWGLPKFRVHPENRQDFFAAELPMRVAFQLENDGSVKKMLVYPPRGQKPISSVRSDSSR